MNSRSRGRGRGVKGRGRGNKRGRGNHASRGAKPSSRGRGGPKSRGRGAPVRGRGRGNNARTRGASARGGRGTGKNRPTLTVNRLKSPPSIVNSNSTSLSGSSSRSTSSGLLTSSSRTPSGSGSRPSWSPFNRKKRTRNPLRLTFADKIERQHEKMDLSLDIPPASVPGPNENLIDTLQDKDVNLQDAMANCFRIEIPEDLYVRSYKFMTKKGIRPLDNAEVAELCKKKRDFYGFMDKNFGRNSFGVDGNQVATVSQAPELIENVDMGFELHMDPEFSGLIAKKDTNTQRDILNLLLSKNILNEGFGADGPFWIPKVEGRMRTFPVMKSSKKGVRFIPKFKFGVRPTTEGNKLFVLPVEHLISSKSIAELGPRTHLSKKILYEPTGRHLNYKARICKDLNGSHEFKEGMSVDNFARETYDLPNLPDSAFLVEFYGRFYAPSLCRIVFDHRKIWCTRLGEQPQLFRKCVQLGRDHLQEKMPFLHISEEQTVVSTIKMENPKVIFQGKTLELSKLPDQWKRRRGQKEICEKTAGTIVVVSKGSGSECKSITKKIKELQKSDFFLANTTVEMKKLKERQTDKADFPDDLVAIVEVFPDTDDSDKYFSRMKKLEGKYGIPVQGIQKMHTKTSGAVEGALDNLNVKMGHSLYAVEKPALAEDALIFGMDVCHPTGRDPPVQFSILQLCSSTDFHSVDRSKVSYHHRCVGRGKEIPTVTALKPLFVENIKHQLKGKPIPKLIIMLRDGVSDDQIYQVSQMELKALKDAIAEIDPDAKPRIVFMVLQKRILCRYHPTNQRDSEKLDGTLFAFNQIASNQFFDLYSKNGQNNPLRLILVEDSENLIQDGGEHFLEMLGLLNSLRPCYAFAAPFRENLPTLPAATQYAHKNAKAIFNALKGVKSMEEARKVCGISNLVEKPTSSKPSSFQSATTKTQKPKLRPLTPPECRNSCTSLYCNQ